jgi:DNA-damage-inducible protein D
MLNKLIVFEDKNIRRILYQGEWYFSVIDVIEGLSGSTNPRRY